MSIYQSIFDIIHNHIYGGVTLTSDMNLTATMLATLGCVFCISLPFMLIWKVFRMI